MTIDNPCRAFVNRSSNDRRFIDGSLSLSFGFMPEKQLLTRLPKYFEVWETMIEEVSSLYYQNRTQKLLENLELLDAKKLDPDQLPRASTLLSILASAYWRHGLEKNFDIRNTIDNGKLPGSLLEPWTIVNERLGRGNLPYQSCYDLFLKNFLLRGNKEHIPENMKIENLDVHLKSFGNECERVFYMSFVEIHSVTSYIVSDICDIEDILTNQSLLKQEQIVLLSKILNKVTAYVKTAISALTKINPVRSSNTYCDPILWAKTVGVFAIPPANFIQGGTSGTSTPIVHVFDSLLGRKKHASYYGKYLQKEGEPLLPEVIKQFIKLVDSLHLAEWIKNHHEQTQYYYHLVESFNSLVDAYAGRQGFLDKHISKVFNYLGVATMVGRNQSTSGHQRYISEETWVQVAKELKIAQHERTFINLDQNRVQESEFNFAKAHRVDESNNSDVANINYLEVAKHYKKNDAWIILSGQVYNITAFLSKHPGGFEILRPYLGQDATREFGIISGHGKSAVSKMLERFKIGTCSPENIGHDQNNYITLKHSLKAYGLLEIQIEHEVNAFDKFIFLSQVHNQFCEDVLNSILPFNLERCNDYNQLNLFRNHFCKETFYDKVKTDIDMLLVSISRVAQLNLGLVENIITWQNAACLKVNSELSACLDELHQAVAQWNGSTEEILKELNEHFKIN